MQQKRSEITEEPYTAHQQAARNLPSSFFVKDKSEMDAGKKRGKLVSVTDGRGYHIAPLSHSYAVLLPEVASLSGRHGTSVCRSTGRHAERWHNVSGHEFDKNSSSTRPAGPPELQRDSQRHQHTVTAHHLTLHTPIGPATKRIVLLLPGLYSGC